MTSDKSSYQGQGKHAAENGPLPPRGPPAKRNRFTDDNPPERLRHSKLIGSAEQSNIDFKTLHTHIRNYEKDFPSFREPKEIGFFSLNKQHEFQDDRSQLRFYCPPKYEQNEIALDLRKGYHEWIKRDETIKEYIDELVRWIQKHRDKFRIPGQDKDNHRLNTDFVCWRGLLTKLLCTPYENRDGWIIAVTFYKGTYYLCEFDTEAKKHERFNSTPKQQEMSYWGYKFEQYVCSDRPGNEPMTHIPVNTNEAYCTVVRTRLEQHSLVFAGEVDCCDEEGKYVELKTSREVFNERHDRNFKRFKLIKWWAQSFLPNVPTVICGYRDDDGVVRDIVKYKTCDIPNKVKDLNNQWKPNVCFNFLNEFLLFIKKVVEQDDSRNIYLFTWQPMQDVTYKVYPPKSKYSFMANWY